MLNRNRLTVSSQSYYAFGARRGSDWTATTAPDWLGIANSTRRGYTSHEMLDNLGLVHMNGRVYDPQLAVSCRSIRSWVILATASPPTRTHTSAIGPSMPPTRRVNLPRTVRMSIGVFTFPGSHDFQFLVARQQAATAAGNRPARPIGAKRHGHVRPRNFFPDMRRGRSLCGHAQSPAERSGDVDVGSDVG